MRLRNFLKTSSRKVLPRPIFELVLRPVVRKVLSLTFGQRGYKISIGDQGAFRLSPDFVFRGWEDFGDRHNWGFNRCIQSCRGKSVFIDIGAHIGLYSLPVSRVLRKGGRVFAFEPSESNYQYLIKHLGYNQIENVYPYQLVMGDVKKDAVPFYEHVVGSSPLSGLTQRTKKPSDRFFEIQKPQTSLDDFCAEHNLAPDVIKIDVEGAELLVLRGAKATLARHRPLLYLSVHPSHLKALGQSLEEVADLLHELNYEARGAENTRVDTLQSGEYICVPASDSLASTEAQAKMGGTPE